MVIQMLHERSARMPWAQHFTWLPQKWCGPHRGGSDEGQDDRRVRQIPPYLVF